MPSFFVTGCDSGFGKLVTQTLDQQGHTVFAGCLTEKGVEDLTQLCSSNVHALACDGKQSPLWSPSARLLSLSTANVLPPAPSASLPLFFFSCIPLVLQSLARSHSERVCET